VGLGGSGSASALIAIDPPISVKIVAFAAAVAVWLTGWREEH
jgi:hypothetical protein